MQWRWRGVKKCGDREVMRLYGRAADNLTGRSPGIDKDVVQLVDPTVFFPFFPLIIDQISIRLCCWSRNRHKTNKIMFVLVKVDKFSNVPDRHLTPFSFFVYSMQRVHR